MLIEKKSNRTSLSVISSMLNTTVLSLHIPIPSRTLFTLFCVCLCFILPFFPLTFKRQLPFPNVQLNKTKKTSALKPMNYIYVSLCKAHVRFWTAF